MIDGVRQPCFQGHRGPAGEQFGKGWLRVRKVDRKKRTLGRNPGAGDKIGERIRDFIGFGAAPDKIGSMRAGLRGCDGQKKNSGYIVGVDQVDRPGERDRIALADRRGAAGKAGAGGDTNFTTRSINNIWAESD